MKRWMGGAVSNKQEVMKKSAEGKARKGDEREGEVARHVRVWSELVLTSMHSKSWRGARVSNKEKVLRR